jgi:hypothetical protein
VAAATSFRPVAEAGGLRWFGLQGNALYRQMAQFAQKILEGKKPSEMQVKGFRLAVDDRAGFLAHDLVGEEGFGAAFVSPACYGSHLLVPILFLLYSVV